MNEYNEGIQAHKDHATRMNNPYLAKALAWDNGWTRRQREELNLGGKVEDARKVKRFKEWIASL